MCTTEWIRSKCLAIIFLMSAFNSLAQTRTINGVVRDAISKQPLASVSVAIKNASGGGVTTDSLGYFAIESNKMPTQLLFSIIGFKTQTVTVRQFNDTGNLKKDTLIVMIQASSS